MSWFDRWRVRRLMRRVKRLHAECMAKKRRRVADDVQ